MKIYSTQNPRLFKALITAKYAGINLDVPAFNYGVDNKTPEFLQKNPTGKVPVLETEEGSISESNAIVRHIARTGGNKALYGKSAFEAGLIDQWIDFSVSEIELPSYAWLFPIQGIIPNNALATKKAQEDIKKVLQILDSHLLTRTYLVGNTVTIADIVVATSLLQLYELVLDPTFRKEFVNANRWFVTIVNQPEFKAVTGDVKLADKMAVAAAPQKKEKAPKEEKPKAEPKKQEEKPKKEAKPAAEDADEDEGPQEPKAKNPLDLLPKSNFIMDEWKRMYSNNDTKKVAMPWFFEHFDPTGYSLFWCTYKYNAELEKVFMTSNLIGGFFQRLEKLHKYAFGSMLILGDEPNLEIQGAWLFRGPEVPADMKECDDYEHYNWTPIDLSDNAQKEKFIDVLAWEGPSLGGKTVNGKVYK